MKKILNSRFAREKFIEGCPHDKIHRNPDLNSYFCSKCGLQFYPKENLTVGWDCPCGVGGIWIGYCPECGGTKPKKVYDYATEIREG